MDRTQEPHYLDDRVAHSSQMQHLRPQQNFNDDLSAPSRPGPTYSAVPPETSPLQHQHSQDARLIDNPEVVQSRNPAVQQWRKLDKKWQKRLYWIIPLTLLSIVLAVLFEVYKSDFERWVQPLTNWLQKREAWSWVIPVAILFILSFPPLFGHEIVQLIVGLTYPLGVAIGIACGGAILGEAGCFVLFKYGFTQWVEKKIATKIKWATIARVTQEAGYRGVLVIRYSIVPPHLANPLFACTGMKFWIYMSTVILSLPKTIIFVALGNPSSENSKAAKYGKVIAVVVLVVITLLASRWIRAKMAVATKEIEAERGAFQPNEELRMWSHHGHDADASGTEDTSYQGAATPTPSVYQNSGQVYHGHSDSTMPLTYQNAGSMESRPYHGAAV